MFDVNELLSKRNQRAALEHLESKKDGCGIDGMYVSEFREYWELNHVRIEEEIRNGTYIPGVVMMYEILNAHGKKRMVSSLNVVDRFITRLISQKLKRYIEPIFLTESFAYQESKGILQAVTKAKEYAENGADIVVEVDLKNFFDTISLEKICELLVEYIKDEKVCSLIKSYLFCRVKVDERIEDKKIGLVQGNSISPILSNLYLHSLDMFLKSQNWKWIRFADNIYIFSNEEAEANDIYNSLCMKIKQEYSLNINEKKSGIHGIFEKSMLGYVFYKNKKGIEVKKRQYEKKEVFYNWNRCSVQKVNREYHIVQDGILNKKDYALLFENEEQKHHIPVEIVDNINMYGNVTVSSNVLSTLGKQKISVSFFDKYGNLMGRYLPEKYGNYSAALLKQCKLYESTNERLMLAKKMEIAGIHNMRSNLRYYHKKNGGLEQWIDSLESEMDAINEGESIDAIMLIEARTRQLYYKAFNKIINGDEFLFQKRTKRPPEDEINAMISFGNTLLYNQFLHIIWKTSLDSRIGIVHATNRRSHSLNLDFADIFKPIITDRVIFSLINFKQIKADTHFQRNSDGGVYLNNCGKKIFLEKFQEKLCSKVVIKNETLTYQQVMVNEIRKFQKYVLNGEKYKPYKYY